MNNTMSMLSITTISFKNTNQITVICYKRQIIRKHEYWKVKSAGNKNGLMRKWNVFFFYPVKKEQIFQKSLHDIFFA